MTRGAWPMLASLMLFDCGLDVSCLYQFVQGCWPDLEEVILHDNDIDLMDVYNVSQDVVQKVMDCKYAKVFNKWLDSNGNRTELFGVRDISRAEVEFLVNL